MIFKKFESRILLRVLFLLTTLSATSYLLVNSWYIYLVFLVPVVVFQLFDFYKIQLKTHQELSQFLEAVHYRDFSRHFNEKKGPEELQQLRKGFNEINKTFKGIAKDKETQYQYLQKVLELVDTGILSFEEMTGDVVWINESMKKLLDIAYVKNIQSLSKWAPTLHFEIISVKPGDSKIFDLKGEKMTVKVLISATAFQTDGKKYKLLAFQNVNEALEETESNAWQRLLSVLTHEIMNSIAPISSLADTLKNRISDLEEIKDQDSVEDIALGIDTIKRRSEGLMKFAQSYRSLNKITKPNLQEVLVRELFGNLTHLMQPTLEQKNITLEVILKDPQLHFQADINLVEQVLINLLVNAIEAIKDCENPKIVLSASQTKLGKVTLKVADNGTGIPEEVIDKMFIPFFTTKKNGSGIGLTLCKQIMRLHKGNIQVNSVVGEGTAFMLEF
ncbi:MAG TPA: HAMP domain-containing sensor histidine kinase [Cytophagales bacterium]|nr:HAMP domain-containing sensor histidine kinase [Cytophagales bacterium]